MSSNKRKLSAGVVYGFSLVLLVMGLISYKPDSILLSIVFFSLSIILFSLAATSQLIDYRPDSKIYYFTILFIITAPLAIYSVGLLIKLYELNLVKFGSSGDWIGFAGSIIGGAMTMFALIFTIQNEDKKRIAQKAEDDNRFKEEKASSYLPIFEAKEIDKYNGKLELKLISVTDKPLRDFALANQEFGNNSLVSLMFGLEDIPLLANSGNYSIFLDVDYEKLPKKHSQVTFLTNLYFQYSDALLIKRYTHKCQFFLRFEKDDSPEGYRFSTIENIKNYPIFESHFYVPGEYPIVLDIESE